MALVTAALGPMQATGQNLEQDPEGRLVRASSANLAFLLGTGWEGPGRTTRDVVTFEYGNTWRYGDTFMFLDIAHIATRDGSGPERNAQTLTYVEIQPRLSLGRMFGRCICGGPLTDVLTAHEINVSGGGGLTHLNGIGLSWLLPGGGLKTNFYLRDNRDIDGVTWQVLVAGLSRFDAGGQSFTVGGFTDFVGSEGRLATNIFSAVQILWDAGSAFLAPGQVFLGVEFHTSVNHLGTRGLDEFVPQAMVKWIF